MTTHWRHETGGPAACGEARPKSFVSNDAMRGVTCPDCLREFNRPLGEPERDVLRRDEVQRTDAYLDQSKW